MLPLEFVPGARRKRITNGFVEMNQVLRANVLEALAKSFLCIRARRSAFLIPLIAAIPIYGQVRVWEGILDLPAYEEGAPDPNPSFDQFSTGRFDYPYTLRTKSLTFQWSTNGGQSILKMNT